MFRAVVLSIALTLAIGPSTTLLCSIWCHPQGAMTSTCPHQKATKLRRVNGQDSCRTAADAATAFVREEAKSESLTGGQQAVVIRPFRFDPQTTYTGRTQDPCTSRGVQSPPLLIALRI